MLLTNTVKMLGCSLILAEVLPARRLVAANGWIEGTTVPAMILGTVLGGVLSANPQAIAWLLHLTLPWPATPIGMAVAVILMTYLLAALLNLPVMHAGGSPAGVRRALSALLTDFYRRNRKLWQDREGRISLGVTSLFWAAAWCCGCSC